MPNMQWNSEADAKLLVAVLKVHAFTVNYQALAEEMGPDCTAKAVTHRLAKLKNIAKGGGSGGASAPSMPRKPRTPAKKKDGAATESGKKRKRGAGNSTYDDDEDDDEVKPTARVKLEEGADAGADYGANIYGDGGLDFDV